MTPDMEAIQGIWQCVFISNPSIGYVDDEPGGFWEIRGNRIHVTNWEDETVELWLTFTLDPTTLPKRIEMVWERTKPNGEVLYTIWKRCYELDGDVLRIGGSGVLDEYPKGTFAEAAIIDILVRIDSSAG